MNNYDDKVKQAINTGTQGAADKKEEVRLKIAEQLKEENMKKRGHAGKIAAAVVAAGLIVTAFTPLGQAAISSISDLFAPQKNIEVVIEGDPEQTDQQLHVGTQEPGDSAVTYVMYIDDTRYEVVRSESGDIITPRDYPDNMPAVYMHIAQDAETTPQALAEKINAELKDGYAIVNDAAQVTEPLSAIRLWAAEGYDSDDEFVEYYLVDNTQGGTFVIKLMYFVEAQEGHGARFAQMLKEFTVIPAE